MGYEHVVEAMGHKHVVASKTGATFVLYYITHRHWICMQWPKHLQDLGNVGRRCCQRCTFGLDYYISSQQVGLLLCMHIN